MRSEKDVKRKCKELLKQFGAYYCMPLGAGYGRAGVPDIIACVAGEFVGIECKWNGNKPSAMQKLQLAEIEQAQGYALVIDENNITALRHVLENITGVAK